MTETKWQFYLKGHDAWDAMLEVCKHAEESIDLEQYVFSDDHISRRFIDTLRERQKSGVKVRMLVDTVGGWGLHNSSLVREMRKDGLEVRFFNPVGPWRIGNIFSWFFRDHRKILVVDKKVGVTGGTGIRDEMGSWRDTNVKVYGPIVAEMSRAFNELWVQSIDPNLLSRLKRSRNYIQGFHFITNSPYWHKRFLYHNLVEAMRSARRYIYLTTPYLVLDNRLMRIVRLAIRRGVDVRIIVPKESNVPFVERSSQAQFDTLLSSGIRIFQYHHGFLHAKTAIIDDEWATVGSFNLDSLSFLYNYEANIVGTDSDFISELKKHFIADLSHSREVSLVDWRQRSTMRKIREALVGPLKRFL